MRRRILTIAFAALAAVALPLGAAFSLDRSTVAIADVLVLDEGTPFRPGRVTSWPEAGTLAVTGGLLLGLASIVRRSA
jgi:hypothetical protein